MNNLPLTVSYSIKNMFPLAPNGGGIASPMNPVWSYPAPKPFFSLKSPVKLEEDLRAPTVTSYTN